MTIRNPVEWGVAQLRLATRAAESGSHAVFHAQDDAQDVAPRVRHIDIADLRDALARGLDDFMACRTDVIFLSLIYPIAGLVLGRAAIGGDMLPMLFPLASGFALIGPFVAIGLYEMSRRREKGMSISWADAFGVLRSPSFAAILVLGLLLMAILVLWLLAALLIYDATLGPQQPASIRAFAHDVFTTGAGWALIGAGTLTGFLFACVAFAVSVVSFPLLIDRDVGVRRAVATSLRVVRTNPRTMTVWALIVTGGLVLGSLPLLVGLIVVMPILGHATWHLYRRLITF